MTPTPPSEQPDIICLHALGGSRHAWDPVAARCDRVQALDLPGFGDAMAARSYDVAAMADHVAHALHRRTRPWLLVGHSMGAKVAALVARRATDGASALRGLIGLILIAGPPPCPEPMDDARRAEMLGWFHDTTTSEAQADAFITANVATPLPPAMHDKAVTDLLRMNPLAWTAWLQHGSREDWSNRIARLQIPTLILAGSEDGDLGPTAQRRLMAPHFPRSAVLVIPGGKHLLPLEQPDIVATLIQRFAADPYPFFSPQ